jgi:hypothetical protein
MFSKSACHHAGRRPERERKMTLIREAHATRDLRDRQLDLAQQFLRAINAPLDHIGMGRKSCPGSSAQRVLWISSDVLWMPFKSRKIWWRASE